MAEVKNVKAKPNQTIQWRLFVRNLCFSVKMQKNPHQQLALLYRPKEVPKVRNFRFEMLPWGAWGANFYTFFIHFYHSENFKMIYVKVSLDAPLQALS